MKTERNIKKTLTHLEYTTALGLFVLANKHYQDGCKVETMLADVIGADPSGYMGHISDLIYEATDNVQKAFDAALKAEGVKVLPPRKGQR